MRLILWVTLALGVLWGGYWFVGSAAVERGVVQWFADQSDLGMTATMDGVSIAGFPSRFDVTVTKPHLADPATGWGWDAPFVQLLAMTWKPWHVIAALPDSQTITAPGQEIALSSAKLQASVRMSPTQGFALQEVVIEGHELAVSSDLGWRMAAKTLVAAMAPDPTSADGQRVGVQVTDLSPDPALAVKVPDLGPMVSTLHLDATLTLAPPLGQGSEERPSKVTAIKLTDFHMNWGSLGITSSGQVSAGADGLAEGRIAFRVKNWRSIPGLLVAMGLVPEGMTASVTGGMDALAKMGKDPDVLDLALVMEGGRMMLGPLPLGPAPAMN